MGTDKIAVVQALRGLAALGVVLWHASSFVGPYGEGTAGYLLQPAGTSGVLLFFVISGFIMVLTTARSNDAGLFFIKRVSRVWPAYMVATIMAIVVQWSFTEEGAARLFFYSALFIPTGNEGPHTFGFPSLNVGWTLNYEMYFYLVFGLSMLFGPFRWLALFSWFALTLIAVPLACGNSPLDAYASNGFATPYFNMASNPLIWSFVAGSAIGLLYLSPLKIRSPMAAGALSIGVIGFATWQHLAHFEIGHGILQSGLSIIPLVLVAVLASKTHHIPTGASLIYLGDISYSLYLVHAPVITVFRMLGFSSWTGFALVTLASIGLAAMFHRYIETDLSRKFKAWLSKPANDRHLTTG